jgi:cytoskeletal protein RodZ
MQTIGERLEEARKKKGISIREAAEATKIRGDYLSKFENNQFDINLTELYVRGFLRTYSQFLRLPADRILNDYAALGRGEMRPRQPSREIYGRMDVSIASSEDRAEPPPPAPAEPPAPAQTVRRAATAGRRSSTGSGSNLDPALVFKSLKWVGAALGAILLLWGVKALFSSATSDRVTKTPASATPVSSIPTVAAEPTVTLIASDTVRVKVVAVSDGRVLLPDTTLVRGQTQIVPKPGAIYITYTAGKNLEVEVNGRRYGMPTAGYDRAKIE